jgi:hypothetical protein
MRILVATKELPETERWRWPVDRQGRQLHRPSKFAKHYAYKISIQRSGKWTPIGVWCPLCHVGLEI